MSSSNEEQTRTLYWLLCRMNAQCDAHFVFYARSLEEAEGRAAEIVTEYKLECIHLKPWPYEFMRFFRLELPRTLAERALNLALLTIEDLRCRSE